MERGVVQIIDSLDIGGAEVLAVDIANALQEKGVNSHICVTRKEGDLKKNIPKETGYCFLNKKKIFDVKAIKTLNSYIKKNKISIVHAHSSSYFFAFLIKLINTKLRIIWHDHYGTSQNLKNRKLIPIRFVSKYFHSIISVNSKLKKWALNNLKCKNVYFLNNFSIFKNDEKLTFLKGMKGNRIIHLAAFRNQKDHFTLISAFELFINKNLENKDWSLHLVGGFNDEFYHKEITKLIINKKLEDSIFIYGSCLDIKHILNQAEIGVLSSKSEGLPVSLLEYGLAKLPVVVTNVGECASIVENEITGYVVESNHIVGLSESLEKLAISKEKRTNFGLALHKRIKLGYSRENFMNQLLNIYKI